MEIMAEDWVRLELGMRLQIGVLRYSSFFILILLLKKIIKSSLNVINRPIKGSSCHCHIKIASCKTCSSQINLICMLTW